MTLRVKLLLLLLAVLTGLWFVVRPPGKSWAECSGPKGIVCIPKASDGP
jgi:hypothetical protein